MEDERTDVAWNWAKDKVAVDRTKPQISLPSYGGSIQWFKVCPTGNLQTHDPRISFKREEALKLAEWIKETFT